MLALFVSLSFTLVHGVSSSTPVSEATYSKANREDFIIHGYEEACGSGGQVDPNFMALYNNVHAIGIMNVDAYWL
jgi:hypothetical protein